jgi:hypothetical protein
MWNPLQGNQPTNFPLPMSLDLANNRTEIAKGGLSFTDEQRKQFPSAYKIAVILNPDYSGNAPDKIWDIQYSAEFPREQTKVVYENMPDGDRKTMIYATNLRIKVYYPHSSNEALEWNEQYENPNEDFDVSGGNVSSKFGFGWMCYGYDISSAYSNWQSSDCSGYHLCFSYLKDQWNGGKNRYRTNAPSIRDAVYSLLLSKINSDPRYTQEANNTINGIRNDLKNGLWRDANIQAKLNDVVQARALLKAIIAIGLPNELQNNDRLRAALYGSEKLPDQKMIKDYIDSMDNLDNARDEGILIAKNRSDKLGEIFTDIYKTRQVKTFPEVETALLSLQTLLISKP